MCPQIVWKQNWARWNRIPSPKCPSSLTLAFNCRVWLEISSCKCLVFPKRQRECSSPHPYPPLTMVSFSAVSVTCGQWQSENTREITHHSQLAWWHLSLLASSCQGSPTINIVCFRHPTIDIIMAPWSRVTQSRRCLPLTYHQEVNSSLMLCPKGYIICLTLCHHCRFNLTPSQEGWVQHNKTFLEREHIHLTFITVLCHNFPTLLLSLLLLCLIYKSNFIIGRYV